MYQHNAYPFRLAICLFCVVQIPLATATADDVQSQLNELREGYLANRAALEHGKCRFRYTRLTADSEADALAGNWNNIRPRLNREYTYFFDKDALTIKTDLDEKKLIEERKISFQHLSADTVAAKGDFAIFHDGRTNNAVVYTPKDDRRRIRHFPFNLAQTSDYSLARSVAFAATRDKEDSSFQIDKAELDGRLYTRVTHSAKYNPHMVYWIDPNRGYYSFRTDYGSPRNGKAGTRMYLLDVHEENGAYFPMHAIRIEHKRKYWDHVPYYVVYEMKVEELDLSYKPTPEDLSISLPRRTEYRDAVNPITRSVLFRNSDKPFVSISSNRIEDYYNVLQWQAEQRVKDAAAYTERRQDD